MADEEKKRKKFVEEIEGYIRIMAEKDLSKDTFMLLLSSLIFTGNTYLMEELEVDELQNICYDIEEFLESLEEISEDDFNRMFNGK